MDFYEFTVESQEEVNYGEIYFLSHSLSDVVKMYIESWRNKKYVTLGAYINKINIDLNYGLLKQHSITDEWKIKADICDYIFG